MWRLAVGQTYSKGSLQIAIQLIVRISNLRSKYREWGWFRESVRELAGSQDALSLGGIVVPD